MSASKGEPPPLSSLVFESALFISDIHLQETEPETVAAFLHFLSHTAAASQASALFILGDLFEFWIGDDDIDSPFNATIISAIAQLRNIDVFFMCGNRDFLVGPHFAHACQLTLLPDPCVIAVANQRLILSHGDLFCTADSGYQRLRRIVHNPWVQRAFLALPRAWRKKISNRIRRKSQHSQSYKEVEIMDVVTCAVEACFEQYPNSTLMIHGHTHRPFQHILPNQRIRWVLPDWYQGHGGYLHIDPQGIHCLNLDGTPFSSKTMPS